MEMVSLPQYIQAESSQFFTFLQEQQKMNIAQGSVAFEDVTVEFTKDEWQYVGPAQRSLYRDVMLENYSHLLSVGSCSAKPQVIFRLEQGEELWSLEEEFLNPRYPGCYIGDIHIEENQEIQEKPLWQVIFIDSKILSKEGQKVSGKTINLDTTTHFLRKIPCKYDSCRMNLPLISDFIVSDRNDSRKKTDYIDVCENVQLGIKPEKTPTGERLYKYSENVSVLNLEKDNQEFQTLEQSFECNRFGEVLLGSTVVCVTAKSCLTEESCRHAEFKKDCEKAPLLDHTRTGTRERCSDLNECGGSWDKTTKVEHSKVYVAVTDCECHESRNNINRSSSLIPPEETVTGQGALGSSKCEETLSQCSDHLAHQKTQPRDVFCVVSGCTSASLQDLDISVPQRTQTEEKFYKGCKHGESLCQNSLLCVRQVNDTEEKSFESYECRKCFSQKAHFTQHQGTHSGEKTYECEKFRNSFCSNSHRIHYPGTSMGVSLYKCNECGKFFCQVSERTEHLTAHTKEKPYNNEYGKSDMESALLVQQRAHTQIKLGQSDECGKPFSKMAQLTEYQRICMEDKPYKCSECGKTFSRTSCLRIHQRVHTGVKPYTCKKTFFQKTILSTHERIHTGEKPYECNECGKTFSRKVILSRHQKIHTGEKPYECNECGKTFFQKTILSRHQRIHTGEKPYACNDCKKAFSNSSDFRNHQRTHTGERPYECNECGKTFAKNSAFRKHQRIHTGERPYECNERGKYFPYNSAFRTHQRIHTRERPYECNECKKAFTNNSDFRKHQRIHTGERPYECNKCEKTFTDISNFRKHQRIHTGEKPYECNECGKAFSQKVILKTHQRIHTRERPYECNGCGKTFSHKGALQVHHSRMHSTEKTHPM